MPQDTRFARNNIRNGDGAVLFLQGHHHSSVVPRIFSGPGSGSPAGLGLVVIQGAVKHRDRRREEWRIDEEPPSVAPPSPLRWFVQRSNPESRARENRIQRHPSASFGDVIHLSLSRPGCPARRPRERQKKMPKGQITMAIIAYK